MKSMVCNFKQHVSRLFKTTSEDSSNVGKKNHDTSKSWLKWYAKYREPCIRFIALKRPQWKDEAEDIVQRVAAKIADDPYITDRGEDTTYRTVICNMCLTELSHIHNPHRASAARKYDRLTAGQDASCHMTKNQAEERILEFTRIQRNNLLDRNYDIEMYYPNLRIGELAVWRVVEENGGNVSAAMRRLGLTRREVEKAVGRVRDEIGVRVIERAKALGYVE